jgi:hypothetical protein
MKLIIVEGTPQEIAEAFPDINMGSATIRSTSAASPAVANSEPIGADGISYVSIDIARKVLSRRNLSKQQLQVLRAIYKAYPGTISGTALQTLINYTRPQFSGLMGAFGRRLSHTEGCPAGASFFEQDWDYNADTYVYGLPESVREAMRLEKLV